MAKSSVSKGFSSMLWDWVSIEELYRSSTISLIKEDKMAGKKLVSRRGFTKGIIQTAGMAVLAKIFNVLPEVKIAFAGAKRGSHYLPENAKANGLTGDEARKVIKQALSYDTSRQLQASLHDFSPQTDDAWAITVFWTDEAGKYHKGPAAAVPFKDEAGNLASLFFSAIDGDAQSAIAVLTRDGEHIAGVDVYQVKNGAVEVDRVDASQVDLTRVDVGHRAGKHAVRPLRSSGCTWDRMYDCLRMFGCSGLAAALCAASFFACVIAPPACVAAFACALYCGGAFALCWGYIGCP